MIGSTLGCRARFVAIYKPGSKFRKDTLMKILRVALAITFIGPASAQTMPTVPTQPTLPQIRTLPTQPNELLRSEGNPDRLKDMQSRRFIGRSREESEHQVERSEPRSSSPTVPSIGSSVDTGR